MNRVFLDQIVNHYMALSKREKICFSICEIKIVEKSDYSTVGALFYDELLASTRDIDLVFQISESAYILILPELLSDDSNMIVQRLKKQLIRHPETAELCFTHNFYEYNNDDLEAGQLVEMLENPDYVTKDCTKP